MSIVLFKPGDLYTSPKGIRCQYQVCDPFSYEHLLEQGWFRTPEECYPEPEVVVAEEVVKVKPEKKKEAVKVKPKKTEDTRAETIKRLKAKKAELLAKQDKE